MNKAEKEKIANIYASQPNLTMAGQTLMNAIHELRPIPVKNFKMIPKNMTKLQKIAIPLIEDPLISGMIANRLGEQINSIILVSTAFAYNESHDPKLRDELNHDHNIAIMINKGSHATFKPLTIMLLLNCIKQMMGFYENLDLHKIFFD